MLFKVNNELGSYMVSESADINYEGNSLMTVASIPRSFGIYDSMYDASNNYIDGVADHYGSVRIYSASYNANDPSTYRDYDIRIIRTADQSLLDIDMLSVNGTDALPTYTDFRSIISNQLLHYEKDGLLGVMSVTYQTRNIADQTNVIPWITLYDDDTGDLISTDLFVLQKATVSNSNVLDNSTGILGDGTVTIDLEVTDLLPSGSYRMELKLVTDEIAILYADKEQSSNASITILEHDDRYIALLGDTYTSTIPFGIYFDSGDALTEIVNFTNVSSLSNIYFSDLDQGQIPSYLTNLEISPFSTLESISLSITMIDSYRHNYRLTYVIHAEDGTIGTYYHDLVESAINQEPSYVYKNGGEVELGIDPLVIGYLEAPTIRVEFDLTETYGDYLTTTTNFIPENIGEEAFIEQDYYVTLIPFVGYEIDMNQDTNLGIYQINSTYDHSLSLWGQTLVWHYDFDTVELTKVKNDDSHLKNIMCVSDTIYSGFNTVVDVLPIT